MKPDILKPRVKTQLTEAPSEKGQSWQGLKEILARASILPRPISAGVGRTNFKNIGREADSQKSTLHLQEVSTGQALKAMFKIGFDAAPAVFCARTLLYSCQAILPLVNATVGGMIMGSLVAAGQGGPAAAVWDNIILLGKLTGLQLILGIAQTFLDVRHRQGIELETEKISNVGRTEQELLTIQMREYQNHLTKAMEGKWRVDRFTDTAFQTMGNTIFLLSSIGAMTALNWRLGAMMSVAMVPTLISDARAALIRNKTEEEVAQPRREYFWQRGFFSNGLYLRDLKLNHSTGKMIDKVQGSLNLVQNMQLASLGRVFRGSTAANFVARAAGFGAYVYLTATVVNGSLPFANFAVQTGILFTLQGALRKMSGSIGEIVENIAFAKHFLSLTKRVGVYDQGEISADRNPSNASTKIDWTKGAPEIRFDNVSFKYPDSERWALKNVSFVIRPGQLVGIIGDNGSGKSTLLKLITGQLRPSSGEILLDGVSLSDVGQTDLWRHLGVVSQDYTVYEPMTVRDNVMMGAHDRDHPLTLDQVVEQTGLDAVVSENCPVHGMDTVLGTAFEGAVRLSGGGGQILANARALVGDPEVLVADEPTSAISWEKQGKILKSLVGRRVTTQLTPRTRVLSTHRLPFLAEADLILELSQGELKHQGSHQELLQETKSFYARGFNAQVAEVMKARAEGIERG